jgi:FHS family L-fucose permease-like MFS transporter
MAIIPSQNVSDAKSGPQPVYTTALFSLAVLYFMMGFITCLNDSLVPFFKAGFDLNYTQSSLVQFYFFLTYGIISIPAGRIIERIGFKKGMIMGFMITASGAFLFYPSSVFHSYELFLTSLFILATGIVVLQVSANPYVTVLGPSATASSRLTLIQGVGSIGTTVAPLFGAAVFLSSLKNSTNSSAAVGFPYLAIAILLLLIAFGLMVLRLPDIRPAKLEREVKRDDGLSVFSFRNLNLGLLGIFAYVGAEVSIGTFLTNYISDKIHIETDIASKYVAFYWGGMLIGRLAGAFVLKHVRPQVVLAILSVLSVLLIVVSIFTGGLFSVWTMIAVGLCNSVMFAIVFSLSIKGTSRFTTQASGLLSTAIVGGALISFAQGVLNDYFSWPVSFALPILCYFYLFFYGINGYKSRYNSEST